MRTIFTALALSAALIASPVLAQQTTPPGKVPTRDQCKKGYKAGMAWTEAQFKAACAKVVTNATPSAIKK